MMIVIANLQIVTSLWMTSLIWVVQWVHYPSFRFIEQAKLTDFAVFHQRRISVIVLPVMILELGSLIALNTVHIGNPIYIASGVLLGVIWASTFMIQVPCHKALLSGKKDPYIARLIRTNWVRTLCWTLKTILVCMTGYV